MTFEQLNLIPPLLKAVAAAGYTEASPIQEMAIPPLLEGKDLLGCAQTGTGKTAAFSLPILQRLANEKNKGKHVIKALILTPTRELALQIQENIHQYGKYLQLRSVVVFGGVNQNPQVSALRRGADILVATPGRLMDLIRQKHIDLSAVEVLVLDEADRMLDMGFIHDVQKVIELIPDNRQTLLFSATLPKEIVKLVDTLLQNPEKIFITPESTTVEKIDQVLYKIDRINKPHLLIKLLNSPEISSALVFTRTKHGADRVVRELKREGIESLAIHGDKSQAARQLALKKFKKGEISVLVATDIAARGIDINELPYVFNYDLPDMAETYVHRIGRTGRAGNGGFAISFCSSGELPYLKAIQKLIGGPIKEITGHEFPMEIEEAPINAQQRGNRPQRSGSNFKGKPRSGKPHSGRGTSKPKTSANKSKNSFAVSTDSSSKKAEATPQKVSNKKESSKKAADFLPRDKKTRRRYTR